jgi:hypothetical protein
VGYKIETEKNRNFWTMCNGSPATLGLFVDLNPEKTHQNSPEKLNYRGPPLSHCVTAVTHRVSQGVEGQKLQASRPYWNRSSMHGPLHDGFISPSTIQNNTSKTVPNVPFHYIRGAKCRNHPAKGSRTLCVSHTCTHTHTRRGTHTHLEFLIIMFLRVCML